MKEREHKKAELKESAKKNRALVISYSALTLFVLLALVRSVMLGKIENAFLCILTLLMFALPSIVKKAFHLEMPNALEILVLVFIFAAEILGEISNFYVNIPFWDTLLHTTSGFIFAAFGFSVIDVLNRDARVKFSLSPIYVCLFAFCFAMTVGVLWEFFEFGVDNILNKDMQKDTVITGFNSTLLDTTFKNVPVPVRDITDTAVNGASLGVDGYLDIGLYDTMEDLLVNFVGSVVFCIIGFFFLKHRGEGKIANKFIPTLKEETQKKKEYENKI